MVHENPACDALVVFGASGDLAHKQIFPALHELVRRDGLDVPIIGVARSAWTIDEFRARARASIEESGALDAAAIDAQWRIVEPVLGNATPLHRYARASWGPAEAARWFPEGLP